MARNKYTMANFTCDRCGTQTDIEVENREIEGLVELPVNWIHIEMSVKKSTSTATSTSHRKSYDFCSDECCRATLSAMFLNG